MIVAQFEAETTARMTTDELAESIVEIDTLNARQQIKRDIYAEALNARLAIVATLTKKN